MYYQHVMAFLQENTKMTRFDIAKRMGISLHDLVLISLGKIKPTREQIRIFDDLLKTVKSVFSLPAHQAYTREEAAHYDPQFKEAGTIFDSSEDKELYGCLIAHRKRGASDLHRFLHYAREPHHQYVDYIVKSEIKNVIEGGMADGIHTKRFLSFAKCVYGFDPLSQCFDSVIDPTIIGKHVQVYSTALWKCSEEIPFFRDATLHCSKVVEPGNNMRVSALSIDDFVRENQIDVDFIKLDVEGSELNVLVGARTTLQSQRPQLAVAIYHTNKDLFEVPLFLKQTLSDYVYRIGHYTSDYTETILYAIPDEVSAKSEQKRGNLINKD